MRRDAVRKDIAACSAAMHAARSDLQSALDKFQDYWMHPVSFQTNSLLGSINEACTMFQEAELPQLTLNVANTCDSYDHLISQLFGKKKGGPQKN